MKSIISSSVLSGIAIGTAGFGYLASGKDIVGHYPLHATGVPYKLAPMIRFVVEKMRG